MFINPSLSERLTQIIEALRRAVAAHGGRHRADVPLVVLLWGYLHRVATRFASLTVRLEKDRPTRPSAPAPGAGADRPAPTLRPRLPQRYGWLAQFGWEIRAYTYQLQHLLTDPDMVALLETSPQARRILRPLCRMLAVDFPPSRAADAQPPEPAVDANPTAPEAPGLSRLMPKAVSPERVVASPDLGVPFSSKPA